MTTTPPTPPTTPPPRPTTPPPSAAPPGPERRAGAALGPPQLLALVGAAAVLISGWLNWVDIEGSGETGSAYLVPAKFLVDSTIQDSAGLNTGILVFVSAALIVVGAFLAPIRWLSLVGGAGGVVIGGLFLYQSNSLVNDINDAGGTDFSTFDFATYFPVLTIVGGIVAVIGGILALQRG